VPVLSLKQLEAVSTFACARCGRKFDTSGQFHHHRAIKGGCMATTDDPRQAIPTERPA
jgi:hypothetical protein